MKSFLKKFWQDFKEYFIMVLLVLVSLVFLSLNKGQAVQKVRAVAFGSFAAATSIVSDIVNVANIKSENDRLREINAELMLQVNLLRKHGIMNQELKEMLELKDTVSYPLVPASIVSKSLTQTQSTITINVGSKDSVIVGMPVINSKGLVGIVNSVSEDYAIARTLRNFDLKITVKDERSRIDAIMKWNGDNLVMINVPKTYDVEPGDRIVTSSVSSIIPLPVPVGIVRELNDIESGIFNQVIVDPFVDFSRVENVFVIKIVESKQKRNLELNFYNK